MSLSSKEQRALDRCVVATLIYFEVLEKPLTLYEVWQFLLNRAALEEKEEKTLSFPVPLEEVMLSLQRLQERRLLSLHEGRWFLEGSPLEKEEVLRREVWSLREIRRVRRWIRFAQMIPFVRGVLVTGRLATLTAQRKSDWDVLILLKKGHIWTGRTLVTLFYHLLRKRRHGRYHARRLCFNVFLAQDGREIPLKDLFAAKEYTFALPLLGEEEVQDFYRQNTSWIREFFPHWDLPCNAHVPCSWSYRSLLPPSSFLSFFQRWGEKVLGISSLERLLGRIEQRKILKNPKSSLPESFIRATDQQLFFFPEPRSPKVFARFSQRLQSFERSYDV